MSSTVPLFINGEERVTKSTFGVTSPITGEVIYQCSSASLADVANVTTSAANAFTAWCKLTPAERRDIFLKTADIMESRKEELSRSMVIETGSLQSWADFNLACAIEMLKDTAGRIATIQGSVMSTLNKSVRALVVKEPYGSVLAIAPWNAPYILAMRAVIYPLACGNTVILKGSELSPRVMFTLVSSFHRAGLPAGVLNFLIHAPCDAPTITSALIAHPAVKKINFTGSTGVGRIISKMAAEHLKPVLLELGGKAPAIVWDDADLPHAAAQCALGAFLNSGQICMSTERIIVNRSVYSRFKEELERAMNELFPPDVEAPALITAAATAKATTLIHNALEKGASIVAGEIPSINTTRSRMRPVAVERVTEKMDIYATESFGPTVSVFEVGSEEEALRLANDTEYGLSSAVFTADLSRALRFAEGIETGAVHVNSMSVHDEPGLPHGGAKASGYGRFNSTAGLDEWMRTKTVTFPV